MESCDEKRARKRANKDPIKRFDGTEAYGLEYPEHDETGTRRPHRTKFKRPPTEEELKIWALQRKYYRNKNKGPQSRDPVKTFGQKD